MLRLWYVRNATELRQVWTELSQLTVTIAQQQKGNQHESQSLNHHPAIGIRAK